MKNGQYNGIFSWLTETKTILLTEILMNYNWSEPHTRELVEHFLYVYMYRT